MPRPATRLPRATEAPAPTTPEHQGAAQVAPAPGNGVPFAQQAHEQSSTSTPPTHKRRGKQLGARIPTELYERLVACSAETRIPLGRLIERALDVELKAHGF